MEGLASNFESVLKHFEENLQGAMYAAVDMELTGTSVDNMPDSYEETATERLSKICQIAESHAPIQIGITLVKHENNCFQCSSYSFYAFPWVGPELLGEDRSFLCRAAALQFNADKNHIDFNKWLKQAVPYMSREDEANYLASPLSHGDTDLPRKVGLLRVWKLLCEARVPLVTHCPLDIFFLMSCFERRNLPREPADMARLIQQCLPCVFDTARLHGCIGGFKNLSLVKFLDEARTRHAELVAIDKCLPCSFHLEYDTAMRYGSGGDLAHDAGFDSLCTAQLYAYLLNLSPEKVGQSVNHLFLFKSAEYLDLSSAANGSGPGASVFKLCCESVVVARLRKPKDSQATRQISRAGYVYKWMDSSHVLVSIISSAASGAVSLTSELESLVPDVQWMCFEEWRSEARSSPFSNKVSHTMLDKSGSSKPRLNMNSTIAPSSTTFENICADASSQAQRWLDGGDDTRYRGVVKRFSASGGYGFIRCPETFAKFKLDVFVHRNEMVDVRVGQEVSFAVSINSRGQPQAKDLWAADANGTWLDCKVRSVEVDPDEGRTTIGASSDWASTTDLDSMKDGASSVRDDSSTLASLVWLGGAVTVA